MTPKFPGFPAAGIDFLKGLEENNNREWFQERKPIFDSAVKAPMMELIEASRTYEANVRMIQNQDNVMGTLISRVLQR